MLAVAALLTTRHGQASRDQRLEGVQITTEFRVHVALRPHIEQPGAIVLVHWRVGFLAEPPIPDCRQRLQSTRQAAPTNLQPIDDFPAAIAPPHHDHEHPLQEAGMPRHPQPWLQHLFVLHALPADIVPKDVRAIAVDTDDLCCKHEVAVQTAPAQPQELVWCGRGRHRSTMHVRTWPADGIDSVADTEPCQQPDSLCELWERLRERNDVPGEGRKSGGRDRHVRDLHVLQSEEQSLRQAQRPKELAQPVDARKAVHRVHGVQKGPLGDDTRDISTTVAGASLLSADVHGAGPADTPMARSWRHTCWKLRWPGGRLVPPSDFDVAPRHTFGATVEKLHIQVFRWHIRRVERREALAAPPAVEDHHASHDRVLRVNRPQRPIPQNDVHPRLAKGNALHRNDQQIADHSTHALLAKFLAGTQRLVTMHRASISLLQLLQLHGAGTARGAT